MKGLDKITLEGRDTAAMRGLEKAEVRGLEKAAVRGGTRQGLEAEENKGSNRWGDVPAVRKRNVTILLQYGDNDVFC